MQQSCELVTLVLLLQKDEKVSYDCLSDSRRCSDQQVLLEQISILEKGKHARLSRLKVLYMMHGLHILFLIAMLFSTRAAEYQLVATYVAVRTEVLSPRQASVMRDRLTHAI